MRRMDELHLEFPFAGSRMLRDLLKQEGIEIGRRHVATLMKRMGIEALYRKPNTSKPAPGHKIYPYLLRGRDGRPPQPGLGHGHHLRPHGTRLRLSRRRGRLVQPPGSRPGGCRSPWRRGSASRRWRRRSPGMAGRRSSTPIRARRANSSGRRNTLTEEVAMNRPKRRSDRAGRAPCPRREDRRLQGEKNGGGSGRRLRQACRVRMLRRRPAYPRRLGHDGSGRRAACHQRCSGHRRSRCPADISRLRNARRSRCCALGAAPCRRWRVGSGGRLRPSPGSCGATRPPAAAAWSIARRRRSGTPSDQPVGRSRRSLRSTRPCGPMCRNAWLAWSSLQAALRFSAQPYRGRVVGMDGGRTDDGRARGARNRSHGVCRSTSRMT